MIFKNMQLQEQGQKQIPFGNDKRGDGRQVMALQMDEIRRLAERVAASHHLEVVDLEFAAAGSRGPAGLCGEGCGGAEAVAERAAAGEVEDLPKGVPVEMLSGVTHEDCAAFATDFGTMLDVEDVVPGAEYTLEVSSPGLERSLKTGGRVRAVSGSLVKVKTFTPVKTTGCGRGG